MTTNWKIKSKDTQAIYTEIYQELNAWKLEHSNWEITHYFKDFPPKIVVLFEMHGVDRLSDKFLSEIEPIITSICNEHNLSVDLYVKANTASYNIKTKFNAHA